MTVGTSLAPARAACSTVVVLGLILTGCESSTSAPNPATIGAPAPTPLVDASSTAQPAAVVGSTIQGDRQANFVSGPIKLSPQPETSPFRFTEIAEQAGLKFIHCSGMTDAKHFPSANGSGVALFDYDNDGRLDLYFATCTLLPLGSARKGPNRLYKNLGDNRFQDVTESSGLGFEGFCIGVIIGDIDNDGDQDVFLANFGPNALFLNNGNGTFTDVSKSAGIDRPGFSSGGAFLDYDNDGDLDLYVANYGDWKFPEDDQFCGDPVKKLRLYCSPRSIRTAKHILYRNNGNLTFTDVTDAAGVGRADGHGFGVVAADLDGDGKVDIYVANDMTPNFLFLNKGDGTFEDATDSSGAAFDEKGQAQSGMGIDAEDINGDGLPDLIVTNFVNEYNTLYQNLGKGRFMDTTPYVGLAQDTMPFVGWGTALADFDNDGWPDTFVTNGHVDNNRRELGQAIDYAEPALLFANLKGERFRLATRDAGPYFDTKHVGRGAAFGDIDNDGDLDIIINQRDGPPALLRNDSRNENHWLRIEVQGTRSARDAIGTRIEVVAGGRTITRQRKGGCSMESANDPRVLIGVGAASEIDTLTVTWPSGAVTKQEHLKTGQTYKLIEPSKSPPG